MYFIRHFRQQSSRTKWQIRWLVHWERNRKQRCQCISWNWNRLDNGSHCSCISWNRLQSFSRKFGIFGDTFLHNCIVMYVYTLGEAQTRWWTRRTHDVQAPYSVIICWALAFLCFDVKFGSVSYNSWILKCFHPNEITKIRCMNWVSNSNSNSNSQSYTVTITVMFRENR